MIAVSQSGIGQETLVRCNLDGTTCAKVDISATKMSMGTMGAALDTATPQVVVAGMEGLGSSKLGLWRVGVDGLSPTWTDISPPAAAPDGGPNFNSYPNTTVAIDQPASKLLVVSEANMPNRQMLLARCDLDGSACAYNNLALGLAASWTTPIATIDATGAKLLVVTQDSNTVTPLLFRCALDGTGCATHDLSAGQGPKTGYAQAVDAVGQKLLVVTENRANDNKASLFRCGIDGTGCAHVDISAGQGPKSGTSPSIAFDKTNRRLLVATDDGANGSRPGLFIVPM